MYVRLGVWRRVAACAPFITTAPSFPLAPCSVLERAVDDVIPPFTSQQGEGLALRGGQVRALPRSVCVGGWRGSMGVHAPAPSLLPNMSSFLLGYDWFPHSSGWFPHSSGWFPHSSG